MPPKVRITEEAIIETAVQLIRERGFESLNAREIAKRLNCSTQPIFWKFKNMDELKKVLYLKAEEIYNMFILDKMNNTNTFLSIGMAYIEFAKNEKMLFKLLFMSDSKRVNSLLEMIEGEENTAIIHLISQAANLNEEGAKQLYVDVWLVTHGIASMIATNSCDFTESEIESILKDSFSAFSRQFKLKESESRIL